MSDLLSALKAGPVVDRRCYTSEAILAEEMERLFGRCWLFVAHESELRKAGDFVTTDIAGQPVIAIRGEDGILRVFLNTCRHRGALVETEPRGCRSEFRCLYHHWEYDTRGRLALVPRQEGYRDGFDKAALGLVPIARVETFHGLVFANLDPDAPDLLEYLGPAEPHLREIATYEGRPMESMGCFEYTYEGNWKLLYENTLDDYHAEYLHSDVYRGAPGFRYGGDYMRQKVAASAEKEPDASRSCSSVGLHSILEWHDPPEKMQLQKTRTHRLNAAIFPAFLGIYHPVLDMTGLRIIKPETVDRTRVLTYSLAPADASTAEKQAIAERFNAAWGPGGRIMMDDLRCLGFVQRGLKARAGGDVLITRGMHRAGTTGTVADEHSIRGFWDSWRKFMLDQGAAA